MAICQKPNLDYEAARALRQESTDGWSLALSRGWDEWADAYRRRIETPDKILDRHVAARDNGVEVGEGKANG